MTEVTEARASLQLTDPPPDSCDVAIVGGGIIGLAVSRALAMASPRLRIAVLEAEPTLAAHQSSHNSGVIHAGIYYEPGSLKAMLCREGRQLMYDFCGEREVVVEKCGKLIVATGEAELAALRDLHRRAETNRVPGLRWLDGRELTEIEPHARGAAALHSPETGIVDYAAVAAALCEDVRERGHTVTSSCRVDRLQHVGGKVLVHHAGGTLQARHVVACAGAWSDRLAVSSGAPRDPRIVPFRGAYLLLRREKRHLVNGLIYPVPDPRLPFLGVHLSRHIDGSVSIGPTALMVGARDAYKVTRLRPRDLWSTVAWPGSWKLAWRFRSTAVAQLRRAVNPKIVIRDAQAYVPELSQGDVVNGAAGVRAQALGRDGQLVEDFVFYETNWATHLRNAPSPAATSSLAIARRIAERVVVTLEGR